MTYISIEDHLVCKSCNLRGSAAKQREKVASQMGFLQCMSMQVKQTVDSKSQALASFLQQGVVRISQSKCWV